MGRSLLLRLIPWTSVWWLKALNPKCNPPTIQGYLLVRHFQDFMELTDLNDGIQERQENKLT